MLAPATSGFALSWHPSVTRFMRKCPAPCHAGARPAHNEAGFALVELLVSLSLVAMILALLPGSVRMGQRAWQASSAQSQSAGIASTMSVIEQRLASALPVFERDADGLSHIAFTGGPDRVRFVATMAGGPFGGGLYRLDLGVRTMSAAGGRSLGLALSPFQRPGAAAQPRSVDHMVINTIDDASFRYFGVETASGQRAWQSTWTGRSQLPSLIEIALRPGGPATGEQRIVRVELKVRAIP